MKYSKPRGMVGDLIYAARKQKGYTARTVAAYLGVTEQFYCMIERGSSPLPKRLMKGFMRKLGIYPDALMDALVSQYKEKIQKALTENFGGDSGVDKKSYL